MMMFAILFSFLQRVKNPMNSLVTARQDDIKEPSARQQPTKCGIYQDLKQATGSVAVNEESCKHGLAKRAKGTMS
jgi:hypothetical protein